MGKILMVRWPYVLMELFILILMGMESQIRVAMRVDGHPIYLVMDPPCRLALGKMTAMAKILDILEFTGGMNRVNFGCKELKTLTVRQQVITVETRHLLVQTVLYLQLPHGVIQGHRDI